MMRQSKKGFFHPRNPKKYKGNPTQIVYRSLWEAKAMHYFDINSNVLEWSSEETIVPYQHPGDGKIHRYFVDFWIKVRDRNNEIKQYLIEVKPQSQIDPPKRKKRRTANARPKYLEEAETYIINQAKWEAAELYAQKRGMQFKKLNEYDLGIKKKK